MSNHEQNAADYTIERVMDPSGFYCGHAEELAVAGADAFGQPVEIFAPQVAERFERAGLAQVMRAGRRIVGFALYDVLQGYHWRLAVYRG